MRGFANDQTIVGKTWHSNRSFARWLLCGVGRLWPKLQANVYRSSSMAVLLAYAVLFASKKSVFTMLALAY